MFGRQRSIKNCTIYQVVVIIIFIIFIFNIINNDNNIYLLLLLLLLLLSQGNKGSVNEVVFHPTENIIASCSSDKQIFIGEYHNLL